VLQRIRVYGAIQLFLLVAMWVGRAPSVPAAESEPAPVSFSREIAPLLQRKCVTCHGPEKAKGGFQLHTFEVLRKPGESREMPITAGQPKASKLYQLLVTPDADDRMPQKDEPLPSAQIELMERWIREGAHFDGNDPKATLVSLGGVTVHPAPPERYAAPVPIAALAFSANGQVLAASGYHEVTFWNPTNGSLLGRATNMEQQTLALAYSPDGAWLAVAGGTPGRSGEVRLLELNQNAAVSSAKVLTRSGDLLLTLAFSPDGRKMAVGGADNIIRVLRLPEGEEERRIEQHADWVTSLAWSPNGEQVASASRDKTARLLDVKTGELEETYTGHVQPLFGVAFVNGNRMLVSGGREQSLHVWQAKEAKKSYEVRGFEMGLWRILASSNDVFTCSSDRLVRHYRLGAKAAEEIRTFKGHGDVVYALAYHAPSQRLATGSYDGEVKIWNVADGKLINGFVAAPR
jgi:hypothetical protein